MVDSIIIDNKASQATCETFWNRRFQRKIEWNDIWPNQTINLTKHFKLVEFNFKLLHHILPSGTHLHKWNMSNSNLCIVCNVQDDYEHVFTSCHLLRVFNPAI